MSAPAAIKVLGHPGSTCTRKVLCVLAEKKEKFDFQLVDLMKGEHKQPAYTKYQPWGVIPTIIDGDFILYESRAICKYLDERFPNGTSLVPKDVKQRALMEQWLSVETSNVTPLIMKIVGQLVFSAWRGAQPDLKIVADAREPLSKALDILDKHLEGKQFFVGDQFTVADISFITYFEYLMGTDEKSLVESRKNLAAWVERVRTRPSWQAAIGKAKP